MEVAVRDPAIFTGRNQPCAWKKTRRLQGGGNGVTERVPDHHLPLLVCANGSDLPLGSVDVHVLFGMRAACTSMQSCDTAVQNVG